MSRRTVTRLASALWAGGMGSLMREAVAINATWERFLADVRVLGGDPDLAAEMVRDHMRTGVDGASAETILGRLSRGESMVDGANDLVGVVHMPHRPGGRWHRHLRGGRVVVVDPQM